MAQTTRIITEHELNRGCKFVVEDNLTTRETKFYYITPSKKYALEVSEIEEYEIPEEEDEE